MVSETGSGLYVEFEDAPWHEIMAHPWLRANVVPHLDAERRYRRQIVRYLLTQFWLAHGWPTELWAYYSAYDHVVLSQVFGRMNDLPEGVPMFSYDLKVEMDRLGVRKQDLPEQEGAEHNALADAVWVRAGYLVCANRRWWEARG